MGKLIDVDALMKTLGITSVDCGECAWFSEKYGGHCKRGSDFEDACFAIENASEAVVRCRDCKHRYVDDCPMSFTEFLEVDDDGYIDHEILYHDNTTDDGYCDRGERRTDETD